MKLRIKYMFGLYYIQRKRKYWFGWEDLGVSHKEDAAKALMKYIQANPEMY